MRTTYKIKTILYLVIIPIIIIAACNSMSTMIKGDDNKMNGGFEIVKQNLPVNWYFYSSETVPSGDFKIIIDTTKFKEGKQSLKFLIHECDTLGGWHSPGFIQGFNAVGGETYKVSFWLMNQGSSLKISTVSGEYLKPRLGKRDTTISINFDIPDWKYFEYYFKVPPEVERISLEVNIIRPGSIWFDDIQIAGTENDKSERTIESK